MMTDASTVKVQRQESECDTVIFLRRGLSNRQPRRELTLRTRKKFEEYGSWTGAQDLSLGTQRRSLDPFFVPWKGSQDQSLGPPQSTSQEVSLLDLKNIEMKGNPRGGEKFSDFQGWTQEPLIGSSLGRTYGREIWSTKKSTNPEGFMEPKNPHSPRHASRRIALANLKSTSSVTQFTDRKPSETIAAQSRIQKSMFTPAAHLCCRSGAFEGR